MHLDSPKIWTKIQTLLCHIVWNPARVKTRYVQQHKDWQADSPTDVYREWSVSTWLAYNWRELRYPVKVKVNSGWTCKTGNQMRTLPYVKHQCQSLIWFAVLVPVSLFITPPWLGVQCCHLQAEELNSLFPWQLHAWIWGAPVAHGNRLQAGIGVLSAAVNHRMSCYFAQGQCAHRDRNKSITRQLNWMGSSGDTRQDKQLDTHTSSIMCKYTTACQGSFRWLPWLRINQWQHLSIRWGEVSYIMILDDSTFTLYNYEQMCISRKFPLK